MQIVALCRAGFEKEVAAELSELAAGRAVAGYVKARDNSGYVEYICPSAGDALTLITQIPFQSLTFVRHWLLAEQIVTLSDSEDRVSPLKQALSSLLENAGVDSISAIEPITLDTNDGKALTRLTRGVAFHLQKQVENQVAKGKARTAYGAQLLFLNGQQAFVGLVSRTNCSPWPDGIPRLRQPREAPSRATLKLEEAWHHFIPSHQWDTRLAGGMRAVDLGAAPGGWTWQLVRRSMFVDAVDNGPMDSVLMESGQVTHHQVDGFAYKPSKPVDWLVCDIADKPSRTAHMIAEWVTRGWCREAVFNLKLPMKQRYQEVKKCQQIIEQAVQSDAGLQLQFKQLYHDREEVTGHLCFGES